MVYKIKNWDKHQHFKDRTPPWVKLYREILDEPDWHELSGDDAKTLICLWLIASEDKTMSGTLPDAKRLAFRLRVNEKQLKQALTNLKNWLIHDDDNLISERYQLDAPETETETETETDAPDKSPAFNPKARLEGLGVNVNLAADFLAIRKAKQKPLTETALKAIIRESEKAGWTVEQAITICCERGWQSFQAKYVENEKPAKPNATIEPAFDLAAYQAKKKVELAADREAYQRDQVLNTVSVAGGAV